VSIASSAPVRWVGAVSRVAVIVPQPFRARGGAQGRIAPTAGAFAL
jgi:hypothetical protein